MPKQPSDLWVYVSGPMTLGDPYGNVAEAIKTADHIWTQCGVTVIVPHLSAFWHMLCPHEYGTWLERDIALLQRCDALARLPGESLGADAEEAEAERLDIPVFNFRDKFGGVALGAWVNKQCGPPAERSADANH